MDTLKYQGVKFCDMISILQKKKRKKKKKILILVGIPIFVAVFHFVLYLNLRALHDLSATLK